MSYFIFTCGDHCIDELSDLRVIYSSSLFTFALGAVKENKDAIFFLPSEVEPLFVLLSGSVYNQKELRMILNVKEEGIIDILKKGYQKWDRDIFNYLNGDFALLIFDIKKGTLIAGQDHIGIVPLYYLVKGGFLAISNHPKLLKPFSLKELSHEWIFHYISRSTPPQSLMPVKDIFKTIPGHYIQFNLNAGLKQFLYWELDQIKTTKNEELAKKEFYDLFANAVSLRVKSSYSLGCELSGGIDSSGVIAMLKNQSNNANITSFSHVSPIQNNKTVKLDEKNDILKVADFVGIKQSVFIRETQLNVLKSTRNTYRHFGFPYYYGMLQDALYEKVKSDGIDFLFSGYGGDHFISNPARGYFNDLVRDNSYRKLIREIKNLNKGRTKSSLFFLFRTIITVKLRFLFRWRKKFKGLFNIPNNRFLSRTIQRKYIWYNFFQKPNRGGPIFLNERIVNNINSTNFSHRLEMSYHIGRMNNFTYRFPLLDKKLMEYYYATSNELKYKNGIGRYIYRRSLEGLVPAYIQWKTNKFINVIPGANMIISNNMGEIKEYLLELKEKGPKNKIFDIDALLKQHTIAENHLKTDTTNKNNKPVAEFMRIFHLLIYLEEFHDGPQ